MADQKDDSSSDISAEVVGHAFVSQFYHILHQSPELVYRFYQDSSTMSRPGPDGELVTVTAMEGIKDLILSLDCTNYKAEILTADAQASHVNGVMVLVTGCLTGKDNVRRKFTESFFLAPQDNGYFVLNDAFRFVEEVSSPVADSVEEHLDESASAAPVTPVEETTEIIIKSVENHTAPAEEKVEPINVSLDEQKSTVTEKAVPEEPSVDSIQNVQPVVETSSNGHLDTPKKSYASLLKNMKDSASTTLVQVPTSAAKPAKPATGSQSTVSPAAQQTRAAVVPAVATSAAASESSAPNGSNGSASTADHVEEKGGHSVYIGDLPYNATAELVEREFKKFGRIKRNGIQVRSNKGYCFGFVEYEDASAKQNAIETGTIRIAGKDAFIEEKKTSTRVVNGVSMYPSGRGGFRNDGYRARGGTYSNGRGFVRNDYGKRNGDIPSRGGDVPSRGSRNGPNGDGFVYQNGGGRGARQGGTSK